MCASLAAAAAAAITCAVALLLLLLLLSLMQLLPLFGFAERRDVTCGCARRASVALTRDEARLRREDPAVLVHRRPRLLWISVFGRRRFIDD